MTGRVFDIQRFSVHDGPGIRTTVFLKGCALSCKWCHNPESVSPAPQLSVLADKCVGCSACVPACPRHALALGGSGRISIDRARCDDCGLCAPLCDPHALQMVGRDVAVDEVMQTVRRDIAYYRASGGGMSLSGGEPLFQPAFALALLRAARSEQIHTVVETSGFCAWESMEAIVPYTSLFLFDCKETDPELHRAFTGQPNGRILDNLKRLHGAGARILLRCPMIPEYNARREHLDGIARIVRELPGLTGVELLPYHRLGAAKLQRFGFARRMPQSVKPPAPATVQEWNRYLAARGVRLAATLP